MLEAYDVMMQASMTAKTWARAAKDFVEDEFSEYPPASRATIIAAYMNAAAGDEIAMHVRSLVEAVDDMRGTLEAGNGL